MKCIQESLTAIVMHKKTVSDGALWIITFYFRILKVGNEGLKHYKYRQLIKYKVVAL